ncbi:hypothetical protein FHX42_004458 [Saccharopolyspora lacisalsi]|uniref:ANTAR domain-containing protein n=1 Tax=Halosaccharopolyspora lacisalsi TaxID=1000566 RepID=A0A839DZY6_9PSEU|nr:GAF and ANTAR domain-containing protein [Halosaccharopolyspora lacisalsi]MBA8827074.1 hypothetical protein [Halosaccharopolyspora lacisalsi]
MTGNRVATVYSWLAAAAASRNEPITNTVLCRTACQHLAVDGASVALMSRAADGEGPPRIHQDPVATTGATSARLEELHLTAGEGPSAEAFTRAAPVLIPDLQVGTSRWPGFGSAALACGVAAIFAYPLRSAATQVGVLTAHRASPGTLASQARADAPVFAELAAHLLRTDPAGLLTVAARPDTGSAAARDEVHQAVGVLSVQLGVGLPAAFDRLRAHAFTHGTQLSDVAREVVSHRLHLPSDSGDNP